ncbi:MAG: GcvT family protein [Gammaproteobacteria bacterium]|nr:GcvT family protein [Gammaproteobacteria bacterium]MBI5614800.1 GcvT family protein [Gammaproteobacteria bacterium]
MNTGILPGHARAVVVGGGIVGCSIAYHLAKLGWTDVVLLERKRLGCGTTWHAAGLVTTLRDSESQTRLAQYSLELYGELERETGQATGLVTCGSIQLAMTPEKAEEMRRGCAMARLLGVENHEISPAEVKALFPLAYVDDLVAGFHFPNDARVNPADVTQALAKGARQRGVRIVEDVLVSDVLRERDRAAGVRTAHGDVRADVVVLCPGMWGRSLGLQLGIDLPLQAAEHYYLISEPIAGLHNKLPILRDPGRCAYAREDAGRILLGIFEPHAAPWAVDGIPREFCFDEIQPDWARLEPHVAHAMLRLPILFDTGIRTFFCGPESFTPDHNYLMGKVPFVDGLFVACGFNSLGILSAGGVGHVMARWIDEGTQPIDLWDVDVRRILPCQNNKNFVVDRTVESLGIAFQMHWPNRQWETARDVRKSVLHERLAAAGACFAQSAGWERANWFARPGQEPAYRYDFGRQNWFENNAAEHRAVREAVGVFDQSSFAKLLVQGRDAERVLNRLATADVAMPAGRVRYAQFLNARGGVEADLTITRLAEERFLVVTAAFTATQVHAWIAQHVPRDACCVVTDVTGAYAMLNVQGPASRALLSSISTTDFSNTAFPFGTMQMIEIGYQSAMAMRVSYTGELGWELYVPTEMATSVYDRLIAAGPAHGLARCGYHTLNTLRIEKAFREWSHDMGPLDTPLECGLAFTCAWHKPGGFIGREALLSQRAKGTPQRRLVQFLLEDPEPMLTHNEPILCDGVRIGNTVSSGYAHTLGACAALGYLRNDGGVTTEFIAAGRFQIEQANRVYEARASLQPLYDPQGSRTRS